MSNLCAQYCAFVSSVAVVFLLLAGVIVTSKTPFSDMHFETQHDRNVSSAGIFSAVVFYLVAFGLSMYSQRPKGREIIGHHQRQLRIHHED